MKAQEMQAIGLPVIFVDVHPRVKVSIFGPAQVSDEIQGDIRLFLERLTKKKRIDKEDRDIIKKTVRDMIISDAQQEEK